MGKTSNRRLKEVLSYKNEHGLDEACEHFNITASTIRRHERRAKNRDLEIGEEYDDPKILIFDLETAPLLVYTFDTGKEYIKHENIKKGRSLLSWSAKWLCEPNVISMKATPQEANERDDGRIIEPLWELINEADILIGHNIDYFDTKVANSRFLINDLEPPSAYRTLDTYKQIRKNFDFTSNSLDYLTKKLCEDKEDKDDHGMDLWIRSVNGDESALKEMEEYNKKDVRVTEDVYFKTRPYFTGSVNLGIYYDDSMGNRCPRCGSHDIREDDTSYYTATGRYKTVRCNDCGGLGRSRFCDIDTETRKDLIRTLAR